MRVPLTLLVVVTSPVNSKPFAQNIQNFNDGGEGTLCGETTQEPITDTVRLLRENSVCTLDNQAVNAIQPNLASNPQNVRNVEAIFPEAKFNNFFPNRDAAYTYENFLKAIGKYPAICSTAELCPKILANMFSHIQQEVAGLDYLEEINKSPYCANSSAWVVEAYPCVSGKMYYGRGAKQLSWNYNYGAFSNAMFGDAMVLLEQPELVATTWLNFAASMWFFVTPQPPKPSMLQVLDGSWIPNDHDLASNLVPGFGVTTMILNGGNECGAINQNAQNRANYYTYFAQRLGVDITGEKLLCNDMDQFSDQGSISQMALYWSPNINCELVVWQTAYSALIEGDYNKCQRMANSSPPASTLSSASTSTSYSIATLTSTSTLSSTSTSTSSSTTRPTTAETTTTENNNKVVCSAGDGVHPDPEYCGGFIKCSQGTTYYMDCITGLYFDTEINNCNWPSHVQCQGRPVRRGGAPTSPSTTTTLSTTSATATTSTTSTTTTTSTSTTTTTSTTSTTTTTSTTSTTTTTSTTSTTTTTSTTSTTTTTSTTSTTTTTSTTSTTTTTSTTSTTTTSTSSTTTTSSTTSTTTVSTTSTTTTTSTTSNTTTTSTTSTTTTTGTTSTTTTSRTTSATTSTTSTTTTSATSTTTTTSTTSTTTTSSTTSSTTTTTSGIENCSNVDGIYPDPDNCGGFINCVHGKPYHMDCLGGLYFDTDLLSCNWPSITQCNGRPLKGR